MSLRDDILAKILEVQNTVNKEDKLAAIASMPTREELFAAQESPPYLEGLTAIAQESDEDVKNALKEKVFIFVKDLGPDEISLFDYVEEGYIEANPGIKGNAYASYVGVYFSDTGEVTGDIPETQN